MSPVELLITIAGIHRYTTDVAEARERPTHVVVIHRTGRWSSPFKQEKPSMCALAMPSSGPLASHRWSQPQTRLATLAACVSFLFRTTTEGPLASLPATTDRVQTCTTIGRCDCQTTSLHASRASLVRFFYYYSTIRCRIAYLFICPYSPV